ncbi:NUDIX domain-containing protein [Treponema pectinovorum]|uniref:(deoxy)nucleoside triphosphate pyrophosphohydrolase n=1 Tax=Treponema pectinovorum TaxID=164 RepID=UPI0011CAE96F|nr:NUDIX domain-containing protein [Treponema pectinovorum]
MNKKSIACIAFKENKVFIAKRNPVGQMGGRWEFPGGKVDAGETDEQSVTRECREEFGVEVEVGEKIAKATFKHFGDDFELNAYLVRFPHDGIAQKFTLTEHSEYRWAELSEIPTLSFVDSDLLIYPQVCKFFANSID